MVMTATFLIMSVSGKAERKSSANSAAYRRAALAIRHIRQELRGASTSLTVSDGPQATLNFVTPVWNGQQIEVDSRGLPKWDGNRTITLRSDGHLVRTRELASGVVDERTLADIGSGEIIFERTGPQLLKVIVRVQGKEGKSSHEEKVESTAQITLSLAAQQFWNGLPEFDAFDG